MEEDCIQPKRALISVADKSGIVKLAQQLRAHGIEILSTGGTAQTLRAANIEVSDVSEHTGFPEIMGGRIKTLHPVIHGGILARRDGDNDVMQQHNIAAIDLVIVNLYPFQQTIAKSDVSVAEAIENIDIGGPTMLRGAAKNHDNVVVIVDPTDYPKLINCIENNELSLALRRKLALKAFNHSADYDRVIANYFAKQFNGEPYEPFPEHLHLNYKLAYKLRYGENPHQKAAFYKDESFDGNSLAQAKQLQGKELSYNNLADTNAALNAVANFAAHCACVIVKHGNPCGVALGENTLESYDKAHRCDPSSSFGGIIAFNRGIDESTASEILSRQFVEVIVAPTYSNEAIEIFKQKPNIRILVINSDGFQERGRQINEINGGILVQEKDVFSLKNDDLKVVTMLAPGKEQLRDLLFAWNVVKTVKSNAVVLAKDLATIGIGAGQTSRVSASKIAVMKANDENLNYQNSVLASDAFFPFRDGVDAAAKAGISAIIQPGGSLRDKEVINAANEHKIAMIFTGMRHFFH